MSEKVLSADEEARLKELKIDTRLSNERYLRDHPEIQHMMRAFVGNVLAKNPDNFASSAAEYFADIDRVKRDAETTAQGERRVLQPSDLP